MERVIYRCKVKATDRERDQLRWSFNWSFARARRGELRLTDRAIQCGDWTIPYAEFDDAALLAVPMQFFTAYNLRVKSRGKTYNFALKSTSAWHWRLDPFWLGTLPFPLRKEVAYINYRDSMPLLMVFWITCSALAMVLPAIIRAITG